MLDDPNPKVLYPAGNTAETTDISDLISRWREAFAACVDARKLAVERSDLAREIATEIADLGEANAAIALNALSGDDDYITMVCHLKSAGAEVAFAAYAAHLGLTKERIREFYRSYGKPDDSKRFAAFVTSRGAA